MPWDARTSQGIRCSARGRRGKMERRIANRPARARGGEAGSSRYVGLYALFQGQGGAESDGHAAWRLALRGPKCKPCATRSTASSRTGRKAGPNRELLAERGGSGSSSLPHRCPKCGRIPRPRDHHEACTETVVETLAPPKPVTLAVKCSEEAPRFLCASPATAGGRATSSHAGRAGAHAVTNRCGMTEHWRSRTSRRAREHKAVRAAFDGAAIPPLERGVIVTLLKGRAGPRRHRPPR